ncbi:anthrax toxin receptor-like [Choloepus didactylus]|uniref:anthrax toxin receptor-like n=1 Tax=Choloepus didactylus TaxID=27675 RepID=UPI00189F7421|nr:anthrax toxin receptor-like [Choloepus didactylus]
MSPAPGSNCAVAREESEMRSRDPWAPFWVLLLLLLQPQIPGAGGRPLHVRGGRSIWGQNTENLQQCKPSYHLYFVVGNTHQEPPLPICLGLSWFQHWKFQVQEAPRTWVQPDEIQLAGHPDLMMSIITVSKRVNVLMLPTADEETIKSATQKLQYEVADGQLNVDEGIKKANEMITRANSGAKKVFSVMIILIGSPIPEAKYQLALEEAKNARKMGTVMFGVGINQYQKFQLDKIVDSSEHIFGQQGTARNLPSYIPKLLEKLCIRLDSLEPSSVCMGESPDVRVHGNGFLTAVTTESVICKFKFSRTNIDEKKALSVENNVITCPGVQPQVVGKAISVEISLNGGMHFFSNNLKVTGKQCGPRADPSRSGSRAQGSSRGPR